MNRKVIYILSEYFAPFQNVGSVKFTKIAKYLSENPNYKIYIFSRRNKKNNDILLEQDIQIMKNNNVDFFYINEGKRYYTDGNKITRYIKYIYERLISKLIKFDKLYYMRNQKAAKKFVAKGMNVIQSKRIPLPDLILSTYDDWGSHYLANEIKKENPNTVWIADFRDPVGAHIKEGKYRTLCDEYSLMVSKNADYVTAVSEGTIRSLVLDENCKKNVVTNGFDYADYKYVLSKTKNEKKNCHKMKFVYTGSFYGHSLMPFFNAIRELIDEKVIASENIEIVYAGTYNYKVFSEIEKAGLQENYVNVGNLSRFDSVLLQEEADVLLTAVWNTQKSQGIIGGKILTYLMLKKPIFGIVIGDVPNSEIKALIERVNCGWCYEQANHDEDFHKLKSIIKELYNKKINEGKVSINYNEEELEKYNLKNIAKQYESIYEQIAKDRGVL